MQVTISIRTSEAKFAGCTVGGDWRIELSLASDPSTIADEYEGPAPSSTFDLTEGTAYNVRGVRLDAAGDVLGPVATDQFTVGEDLVPIDVASGISVVSTPTRRTGKK